MNHNNAVLFLNGEDISTKADSHICRCYSTTNNQDIHRAVDKYSINKKKKRERGGQTDKQTDRQTDSDRDRERTRTQENFILQGL